MSEANPEVDDLKRDIEALREDLHKLGDDVRNSSGRQAQESLVQMRGLLGDLCKKFNERGKSVSGEIESRPFTSVFAAFGIGLLLGKLIGR